MERVDRLEGTVSVIEGELAVVRNVKTLLSLIVINGICQISRKKLDFTKLIETMSKIL